MALRDRFNAAVKALTGPDQAKNLPTLELKHSHALAASMAYRVGIEQYAPIGYRKLVPKARRNPIVMRCVELVAQSVAAIEPVVKIGGRDNDRGSKAVLERLKKPNPTQDRYAFVEQMAMFYRLHGNVFVEMAEGMPGYREFYALRPELFTITPGPDGWAARYTYKPGTGADKSWNVEIQAGRTKILHIRAPSADDDLWGHGSLEAAELALQNYDSAWENALALLKNGAMPSGALKFAPTVAPGAAMPTLTEEQYQKLKQQLANMTTTEGKGKPLLLEGGLEWVQMAMSYVDMQADELRNDAARDIARAFGVPPMLLGIPGDNTYSNYQEANRAFYRQTVLPMAQRLYGALGRWWAGLLANGPLKTDALELVIDEAKIYALAEERAAMFEMLEAATFLKLDEKRVEAGYEPLEDGLGDQVYQDGFRTPLGASVRTAEAGATPAEIGNDSAEVALQYQIENPAYDPAKDADGDGTSSDGTGKDSTKKPAPKKA